jgi:hypothetical protein
MRAGFKGKAAKGLSGRNDGIFPNYGKEKAESNSVIWPNCPHGTAGVSQSLGSVIPFSILSIPFRIIP